MTNYFHERKREREFWMNDDQWWDYFHERKKRKKDRERILDERWPIIFTREKKRKRERKNFWMNDDQWWCYFHERKKREREREFWMITMMRLFSRERKREREREKLVVNGWRRSSGGGIQEIQRSGTRWRNGNEKRKLLESRNRTFHTRLTRR